jgi:hypothetical protein
VRAGLHGNRNRDGAIGVRLHPLTEPDTHVIEQLHALAIDQEFDFFTRRVFAESEILNFKFVFAIGWETCA